MRFEKRKSKRYLGTIGKADARLVAELEANCRLLNSIGVPGGRIRVLKRTGKRAGKAVPVASASKIDLYFSLEAK